MFTVQITQPKEVITSYLFNLLFNFQDKTFYLVHGLNPPGRQAMADIIESAGGTVDTKRRSSNYIKEVLTEKPESYLVLCCREHLTLVRDLLEANIGNKIYTS